MNELNEKQLLLLRAVDEVIAIKGYRNTTVRDVAKNAGVNIALISYYFGSKEKMMYALLAYKCEDFRIYLSRLSSTLQMGIPSMQLRELIRYCVHYLFKILYLRRSITEEFGEYIPMNERLRPCLQLLADRIDETIKKGIVSGYFTFAQRAEDLVAMMVGMIFFAFEQEDFYSSYIPHQAESEYLTEAEKRIGIMVAFSIFSSLGMCDEK